jgi:hypothetical protein
MRRHALRFAGAFFAPPVMTAEVARAAPGGTPPGTDRATAGTHIVAAADLGTTVGFTSPQPSISTMTTTPTWTHL